MSTVYNIEISFRKMEDDREPRVIRFMLDSLEHNIDSEDQAKSRAESILEDLGRSARI